MRMWLFAGKYKSRRLINVTVLSLYVEIGIVNYYVQIVERDVRYIALRYLSL